MTMIALKAGNGTYVGANPKDGTLIANRQGIEESEKFEMEVGTVPKAIVSSVALKSTSRGSYVSVTGWDGQVQVGANDYIGLNELFEVYWRGADQIALMSASTGCFLAYTEEGNGTLQATGYDLGPLETFQMVILDD
ncbi:MAG: hypothetical protein Roseis2KO_54550 [Roseivirga sp.]